jgi:hypothetical protein
LTMAKHVIASIITLNMIMKISKLSRRLIWNKIRWFKRIFCFRIDYRLFYIVPLYSGNDQHIPCMCRHMLRELKRWYYRSLLL